MTDGRGPTIKLPFSAIMPVAYIVEGWARVFRTGEPFVTVDALRMARKFMYFSSARAVAELNYRYRPAVDALHDAIEWFQRAGYISR